MSNWTPTLQHDFEDKTPWVKFQEWAKKKQEVLAISVIVVLLLSVGVPYYLKSRQQAEQDAAQKLSIAQYYLSAHVDAKNGPFKSEAEKYQAALQQFQQVSQQGAGTGAAKVALFYVGKCQLIMGQSSQAYVSFDEAAQKLKGTPLGQAAWVGKGTALLLQQKWAEAAKIFETYLTQYPDGYLTTKVRLDLADTYLQSNQKDKAIQILQDVVKKNAGSEDGREAARFLKSIQG